MHFRCAWLSWSASTISMLVGCATLSAEESTRIEHRIWGQMATWCARYDEVDLTDITPDSFYAWCSSVGGPATHFERVGGVWTHHGPMHWTAVPWHTGASVP